MVEQPMRKILSALLIALLFTFPLTALADSICVDCNPPSGSSGNIQYNQDSSMTGSDDLYWDDTNMAMGIGTTDPSIGGILPWITINGVKDGNSSGFGVQSFSDTAANQGVYFCSSARGTEASPAVSQSGDNLCELSAYARDTTFYSLAARIQFGLEGTVTGTTTPGYISILTENSSGTLTEAVRVDSAQEIDLAGVSGDGTGATVCVKSDGNLGTCSDQPNGSGVCTCG